MKPLEFRILTRLLQLRSERRHVRLIWIPSYTNIPGNNLADAEANVGRSPDSPLSTTFPWFERTAIKKRFRQALYVEWCRDWTKNTTSGIETKKILPSPHPTKWLERLSQLSTRAEIHRLMKHWTNDNILAATRYKNGLINSPLCACGRATEMTHHLLWKCDDFQDKRDELLTVLPKRFHTLTRLSLRHPKAITVVARFLHSATVKHMTQHINSPIELARNATRTA
jgi:hypothetical protein